MSEQCNICGAGMMKRDAGSQCIDADLPLHIALTAVSNELDRVKVERDELKGQLELKERPATYSLMVADKQFRHGPFMSYDLKLVDYGHADNAFVFDSDEVEKLLATADTAEANAAQANLDADAWKGRALEALEWTDNVPTVAGWYWFKRIDGRVRAREVILDLMHSNFMVCDSGYVVNVKGQWCGPIPVPTERQAALGGSTDHTP